MKKYFNKVLLTFSAITILLVIARLFNALQTYIIPTAGNEPTIKAKTFFLGTNLIKPKKLDFVIFKQTNPKYDGGYYCQRLVGEGGDKIQIVNGNLFVNDKSFDLQLNLNHAYIVGNDIIDELITEKKLKEGEGYYQISENKFVVQLSKKDMEKGFECERYINKELDTAIVSAFGKNWNADNFGPITIPKNKIFTLGDNRNASLDSRYLGFIDVSNIHGKLFFPVIK